MNKCCKQPGDIKKIVDLARLLKLLSEPNRLKIICLLQSGTRCVCEIQDLLDLPQNLVSHHLKVLKDTGFIDFKKKGQWKYYTLNRGKIHEYKSIFNKILTS